MYLKLQYFTRVFHPDRPSFVDTMATAFKDTAVVFASYLAMIWAFTVAFYVAFSLDQAVFTVGSRGRNEPETPWTRHCL